MSMQALGPAVAPPARALVLALALLAMPAAHAAAIVGNGAVALGVQDDGALGVSRPPGPDGGPVGDPVAGATVSRNCGTTATAIRHLPADDEGTWCGRDGEGWGVAAGGLSGWAFGGASGGSLSPTSFLAGGSSASSVARVGDVEVRHGFSPSAAPELFQVSVTLTNLGAATLPEVLYRRVVHWGTAVAASDTTAADLALRPGAAPGDALWRSSLEPGPADPLASWTPDAPMQGPPTQPDRMGTVGVAQGTTWDLRFLNLHPREARSFTILYGAAPDAATALAALDAAGAQAYSLSMRPRPDGAADRSGIAFATGLAGVPDARSTINDPPEAPSPPCIGVPPGQPVRVRLPDAHDLEEDPLEYSVGPMPDGMVFWPGNRTLHWVPPETDLGRAHGVAYTVTEYLRADGTGAHPGDPGIVREQSASGEVCLVVQDAPTDRDRDGVGDLQDNCPGEPNKGQEDTDRDGTGDACEPRPAAGNATAGPTATAPPPPDRDRDGVRDALDRCPDDHDPEQEDADRDRLGDACDADQDGDSVPEAALHGGEFTDNCPGTWNPDQRDRDGDGKGDSCDPACAPGTATCTATDAPTPTDGPAEVTQGTRGGPALGLAAALAASLAAAWRRRASPPR